MRWAIETRDSFFDNEDGVLVWYGDEGELWQDALIRARRDDPLWNGRIHIRASKGLIVGPQWVNKLDIGR